MRNRCGYNDLINFKFLTLLSIFTFYLLIQPRVSAAPLNDFHKSNYKKPNETFNLKSSSFSELSFSFHLPEVESSVVTINGEGFDNFSIDGFSNFNKAGWPQLPSITKFVLIPAQSGVDIEISKVLSSIVPSIEPISHLGMIDENTDSREESRRDESTHFNDGMSSDCLELESYWPPEIVKLGEVVIFRGQRMLPLIFSPLRWNPSTSDLQVIESLEVELDFTSSNNRYNLVENPGKSRPSRFVSRIMDDMLINPPARDEPDQGGSILYVTGDWDNVVTEVETLIEWRRRMGWTAGIVRVEENNNRQEILNSIREAYDDWEITPEFVVLVGDGPGLQGNQFTLAYWNEAHGARTAYETDHHYSELEGDDLFPEVAIGRLTFSTIPMLRGIINKIINYESEPFIGNGNNRGWQRRAIVAATDSRSGTSSIDVCNWFRNLALNKGFSRVNDLFWSNGNRQPNPTEFITDNFDAGISIMFYRGWSGMNGFETGAVSEMRNGELLPFVMLATCNTGDYGQNVWDPTWSYCERFLINPNGGAIASVGAAGATHTAYNNILATETMRSIFVKEINFPGWALMDGKLALYNHYADRSDIEHPENPGLEAWLTEFYIFNLMGDPATNLFTSTPGELIVEHPESMITGESRFTVSVEWDDEEQPAAGVQVCLYKPDLFQLVKLTDSEGLADFILNPENIDEDEFMLTISGRNILTYLEDIPIVEANYFIGAESYEIDDDREGESNGDNDGSANPAERIEIEIELTNFGSRTPEGNMDVRLIPLSGLLEVVDGEISFEEAPESGESVNATFVVDISGAFENEVNAVFEVQVESDDRTWISGIEIPVSGPEITFNVLDWVDSPPAPGDTAQAYLVVKNIGDKSSPALDAVLTSLTETVTIINAETNYDRIGPQDLHEGNEPLTIAINSRHLGGMEADFSLVLEGDNGFIDTANFSIVIDRPRHRQPFGPDDYGYICIDYSDTSWVNHPRFEWIEIASDHDGPGTNTNLRDRGEEEDESVLIDLPFEFVYYGESFDEVTICSNGWMAFGNHQNMNSARNRHIPGGEVSPAMLCPFWDDLIIPAGQGGVYYWYDEDHNQFIVEWSRVRKLGPLGSREPDETFEVILFDPQFHISLTGDGDIVFQYLEVTDSRSVFERWDTPYATVGIGSPDQLDGIEYTYWGELVPGAAPLIDEAAIKFTTMVQFGSARVVGNVSDAATNEPIDNAVVRSSFGTWAMTNGQGNYVIEETLVANGYSFTASGEFFNDSTKNDIDISGDDINRVDFRLRHPEFNPSVESLEIDANYVETIAEYFDIVNTGNGLLTYRSQLNPREDDEDHGEPWDIMLDWNVGDITDDTKILGITYCDGYWLVSGGNSGRNGNWFYKFNRRGEYIERYAQPDTSRYGVRDLEYYENALYTVNSLNSLYKIDPDNGNLLRTWDIFDQPLYPVAITIDTQTNRVFIASTTRGLYQYKFEEDSSLTHTNTFTVVDPRGDHQVINPWGMSWFEDDPDDHPLYLYSINNYNNPEDQPDISLYKMNPETEHIISLTDLPDLPETHRGRAGCSITPLWDRNSWAIALVLDDAIDDRVAIFNLAPNYSWVDMNPQAGELYPGQVQEVELVVFTDILVTGDYTFDVHYEHNADPGFTNIPVSVSVQVGLEETEQALPAEYNLSQNYPNPFNPETKINYSLKSPGKVLLKVFDISGREVRTLVNGEKLKGSYQVQFDASELSTGIYFYSLKSGSYYSVKKMILVK